MLPMRVKGFIYAIHIYLVYNDVNSGSSITIGKKVLVSYRLDDTKPGQGSATIEFQFVAQVFNIQFTKNITFLE